jgi:NAD-dependent deacetylase
MTNQMELARELIDRAETILAFVGAGFSADSGIPTFRGEDGIFADDSIERLAHAEALEREPERALAWLEETREMVRSASPNAGHRALVELAESRSVTVATQNIDGLVDAVAGERGVDLPIHYLHGSLFRIRCHACGTDHLEDSGPDRAIDLSETPECPECGGLLRPNIVLFGELLPDEAFGAAEEAARAADLCLMLGTSGAVYPAAGLPRLAADTGAAIIEINPNPTDLSGLADIVLRESTTVSLPKIIV